MGPASAQPLVVMMPSGSGGSNARIPACAIKWNRWASPTVARTETRLCGMSSTKATGRGCSPRNCADRRAFRGFGREQRVGEAERVEMRATGRAMLVRHCRQHDDLGIFREPGDRLGRACCGDLPIGLQPEEFVEQRRDALIVDRRARGGLGDVAVQAKRLRIEFERSRSEEADERVDEFEQHLVNVEHKQRPRVARQFGDLPDGFGVVAHLRRNSRRCLVAVVALRQRAHRLEHGGRRYPRHVRRRRSASARAPR